MEFIPEIMVIKGAPGKSAPKKMVYNYFVSVCGSSCAIDP